VRGPSQAPVTLVEYGDFECPYCGQAEPIVRELLADYGDVRYVWRHCRCGRAPHAQLAAEASEAAARQGGFWPMHTSCSASGALLTSDLVGYAELSASTSRASPRRPAPRRRDRVAQDVDSADLSGVSGTPTFFVNGRRHQGAFDIATLSDAVRLASQGHDRPHRT